MIQYLVSQQSPVPRQVLAEMKPAVLRAMVAAQQKAKKKAAVSQRRKSSRATHAKLNRDVNRIAKLIKNGTIAARQQKKTWRAYAQGTDLQKKRKFRALYKPALKQAGLIHGVPGDYGKARKKSKSRSRSRRRPSITTIRASLSAQQQRNLGSKYYLVKGRTVRYGGGATGPGSIRVIPGTGATPFNRLSIAQKQKVLSFLNTPAGKKLRGKGAKRTVQVQAIMQQYGAPTYGPRRQTAQQKRARIQAMNFQQLKAEADRRNLKKSGGTKLIRQRILAQISRQAS
jgi:hypothetical protein